jgi:hypothetical protein
VTEQRTAPGRGLTAWRRDSRRTLTALLAGGCLAILGMSLATEPGSTGRAAAGAGQEAHSESLEERLRRTEDALMARQGELELARLELKRLQTIVEQAQRHRIPPELAASIHDIAVSEGVDPALAFSLVRVESGFARRAVSSAGAVGLTQVMPSTAHWLQPGVTRTELFEPATNLRLGFRYLRLMLKQYDGDMNLALLAYNRGPGRVNDILEAGGNPNNGYPSLIRNGLRLPRP